MKKIFMVFLGGKAPSAKTEAHDIVFVASDHINETHDVLRAQWFGLREGLHIDSYREVSYVENYKVLLSQTEKKDPVINLYFVQMGGYIAGIFGEFHAYELVVASSLVEARQKAKEMFFLNKYLPHVDQCMDIDDIIYLDKIAEYTVILKEEIAPFEKDRIHNLYHRL